MLPGSGIGTPQTYETIYSGMPLKDYLEAGEMSDEERLALRTELGFQPHHRIVIMAARLEERKGHAYLFESVHRLKPMHPDLRVLILGEGNYRPALETQCRVLGIDDVISFSATATIWRGCWRRRTSRC